MSPVSRVLEFMEARKTCHRVVWTSVWSIPLQQKLYHQDFRDIDHLVTRPVTLLGPSNQDAIKAVPDQLLKRVAMLFRVHTRHVELLATY